MEAARPSSDSSVGCPNAARMGRRHGGASAEATTRADDEDDEGAMTGGLSDL